MCSATPTGEGAYQGDYAMRRLGTFLLSVVGTTLFASTAALATPVQNIAGVSVPVGSDFITETDYETLISGPSSNFMGIGVVTGISDGGTTTTYGFGGVNPPPYLYDEFSGFTVDTIHTNADGSLDIFLKGGQLSYYSFGSDQQSALLSEPTAGAAVGAVEAGSLWLSLTPQAIDSAGDTLDLHVPSGNLSNVGNSSAYAYADVTTGAGAGPANSFFNNCSLPDTDATGSGCAIGLTDFSFNGGANNSTATTAFQVSGTGSLKTVSAVPVVVAEPLTISLFGAGLIGVAALRRRKTVKAA
jgi:hypothetical protein